MAAKRKEGLLIKIIAAAFLFSLGAALTVIITSWIVRTGALHQPLFWAIAVVEVATAYLLFYRVPYRLRVLVMLTAFFLPALLGTFIEVLRPLISGAVVLFMTGVNIAVYEQLNIIFRRARPLGAKKKQRLAGTTDFNVVLPEYLPQGFTETSIEHYRTKGYTVVEAIYTHADSEHLIWLKEANGPIPDDKPLKNAEVSEKTIKGVDVTFWQEILKPFSKQALRGEPAYVEASWSNKGINFNLRSDGLSMSEAEKVIASML